MTFLHRDIAMVAECFSVYFLLLPGNRVTGVSVFIAVQMDGLCQLNVIKNDSEIIMT